MSEDVVVIEVPADVTYVSTLRLAAASLAARCELTIDDIEDLRLAVDEACALLLPHARGDRLHTSFTLSVQRLDVSVVVRSSDGAHIDRNGFAWTVLGALASDVDVSSTGEQLAVSFSKRRTAGVS